MAAYFTNIIFLFYMKNQNDRERTTFFFPVDLLLDVPWSENAEPSSSIVPIPPESTLDTVLMGISTSSDSASLSATPWMAVTQSSLKYRQMQSIKTFFTTENKPIFCFKQFNPPKGVACNLQNKCLYNIWKQVLF